MSSPQPPWSPGQPAPAEPPQGYGVPLGYGSPQGPQSPQPQQPPTGYGAPQAPQGYGTPQPYGQPPSPQPQVQPYGGPVGELVLNLRKPFGAMGMITPIVTIDGHPAGAAWGRNSFSVPAGVRQVDVAQSYMWTYGRASHPVNVTPGGTSEVFYSGPLLTFGLGGAMGPEPQKRPGRGILVGLLVFVFLVLLIGVLAVVVGNS
ncbi:hypothetical protein [Microlunatus antarcticus]|uniref:Uncharacterized protein n=1 Tax=Microlunatus antarcticus TaxID=53388 RepID=A0A7W5JZE7_9ACTN|nr:hypothetical protein [Microlunatus antarcticus]MBB3329154.1 hypothetical protein [Microlunatus antarcticus]